MEDFKVKGTFEWILLIAFTILMIAGTYTTSHQFKVYSPKNIAFVEITMISCGDIGTRNGVTANLNGEIYRVSMSCHVARQKSVGEQIKVFIDKENLRCYPYSKRRNKYQIFMALFLLGGCVFVLVNSLIQKDKKSWRH